MGENMKIELLAPSHPFSSNCYLISSAGEYAVIDPSSPFSAEKVDGKVKYILLTHSHFDHILEIDSWVNAGAEVLISEREVDFLADPGRNCYRLYDGSEEGYFGKAYAVADGEEFILGNENFKLLHLPGHTIGSSAYIFSDCAFVGDTVFAGGGYGRWDLPSGDMFALYGSIKKVKELPDSLVLYSGHGEPTTVKQYKLDTNK